MAEPFFQEIGQEYDRKLSDFEELACETKQDDSSDIIEDTARRLAGKKNQSDSFRSELEIICDESAIAPVVNQNVGGGGSTVVDVCADRIDENSNLPTIMNSLPMMENMSLEKKSVLLMVCIFTAGAAYCCLFSLDNIFPGQPHIKHETLRFTDIIPGVTHLQWMDVFHFILLSQFTFSVSMGVILVSTWSLVNECSFCYRVVPIFMMVMMFLSYVVLLKNLVPDFCVAVGSSQISSFWIVWLSDLPLIFIGLIWMVMVKFFIFSKTSGNHLRTD